MTTMEKSASARLPATGNWLQRIFSALGRAHARRVAMRELYALDNRLLQDIGLRRDEVGATVSAMFRSARVAEVAQSTRKVAASDVAAAGVGKEHRYQSAA